MCSCSQTDIMLFPRTPVVAVMLRTETRLAEITYLIMLIASCRHSVDEGVIHFSTSLLIKGFYLAFVKHSGERCSLFIHKGICRYMLHIEGKSFLQVISPLVKGLPRKTKYQINRDILYASFSEGFYSRKYLTTLMTSMKEAKPFIRKRLHTHRDTIDAIIRKELCKVVRHIIRVAFYRPFSRGKRHKFCKQFSEILKREHRRSTTAYIKCRRPSPYLPKGEEMKKLRVGICPYSPPLGRVKVGSLKLFYQRFYIQILLRLPPSSREEVAIEAP